MADTKKQIVLAAVVLSGLALAGFGLNMRGEDKDDPSPSQDPNHVSVSPQGGQIIDLETAVVQTETLDKKLRTTGQVLFSPDQTVKIAPRLQGRVRSVLVKVGDRVSAGQVVAILESVDAATAQTTAIENKNKLALAKLKLDTANRQFSLGTPEVTAARAALAQAKEGTASSKLLLEKAKEQAKIGGFTEKPLEDAQNAEISASAAVTQARADLALAQKDLDRKTKLVQIGVAAQSDLEISKDSFDKAQASVDASVESLKLATQARTREQRAFKSNLYADQQVEQTQTAYNQAVLQEGAAQRALSLAEAAVHANLEQARSDYQIATSDDQNAQRALVLLGNPAPDGTVEVRSPISGVVTERDVNSGQVVDQSQMTPWQMLVICAPDPVWVDADVYEKDLPSVNLGAPVTIEIGALPSKTFSGKVLRIAPTVDRTTRSEKVRAEISNPSGELKDGMYASVSIRLAQPRQAMMVPLSAVVHDGDKDYAFLKSGDHYDKKLISLGSIEGDSVEVLGGLGAGQTIVKHGALYLGNQQSGD